MLRRPLRSARNSIEKLNNDIEPLLDEAEEVIKALDSNKQDAEEELSDDASTISAASSSAQEPRKSNAETSGPRINNLVQNLMDLGPSIENNLISISRKVEDPSQVPERFNVSTPARPYVSLIKDKFPQAALRLIERLGEANWQRHVIVRDRAERGADDIQINENKPQAAVFSQYGKVSLFQDSGIGTSVSAGSKHAPSTASHNSFASSVVDGEHRWARVPPTPNEVSQGKPFLCSICLVKQNKLRKNIQNRVDWK